MSGKRQASYSIDPNTLEARENDAQQNLNNQTEKSVPKEERKIFKIKKPGQSDDSERKETKVAFKLNQSQQIKPTDENGNVTESKPEEEKSKQASNPFANLFKKENVFHGIGIFSNVKSTNLFTANKGTQQTAKTTANPFAGPSIFANKGPSIFDNSNSIKNTGASLFSKPQIPGNDDDGSGDSAQLQEAQKIEANPQKSKVTYSYDDSCPILLTLKVSKFKKSGGQLLQNLEIVLQKQKQTNIKYITVRLPATKKNIFSGVLIEGRSDVKHIHGKKQNVEVGAFYKQKETFAKTYLKFQFENAEDGEKLFERLQELLGSAKKQVEASQPKEKKQ